MSNKALNEWERFCTYNGCNNILGYPSYLYHEGICDDCLIPSLEKQREDKSDRRHEEDKINRPAHYTHAIVESIDLIESLGYGPGFCLGNAIKYLIRCQHKGSRLDDLNKAIWYIERVIKFYEKEEAKVD